MNRCIGRDGAAILGAFMALAVSACATTPKAYIDVADEPPDCERFGWYEEPQRPVSIAEQRVRDEVMRVLEGKGYTVDAENPDCRVSSVIFTGDRPGSPVSVGLGAGSWGGSVGGSVGISLPLGGPRKVGNLAIDVIDTQRNAQVWRGTLEGAFRSPEAEPEAVRAAVERLLETFPPRGGG